ncbi:MAG: tRNA-splicing ligase RtcB [candidate division TM6 bacterium GW2011_GWF2_30_66]|jgi:tRNA-splicing ligase RtcB|nr:MAG: tRNA-splicing ligase RtcB [candidate division TM6 bacterium GW2011_GWF2_30_66]
MPDIHQGYGFPIGGVAGCDINSGGVISPGGIGYDINCGVRLLVSNINNTQIMPYIQKLATEIFSAIPSGVGRGGKLNLKKDDIDKVLKNGANFMLNLGFGDLSDLEFCEERGCMSFADPSLISDHAKKRGHDQLGTLGSGNHFLEVQYVEKIYDKKAAQVFGLTEGLVTVMIHTGSRGLGHQVCTDYVGAMINNLHKWKYDLPDRQLVCAPFKSQEGQDYFGAMAAAANFAWANRHTISHWTREAWQKILGPDAYLNTLYDVSHNLGKIEKHKVDGIEKELLLHRKGATRSFGPGTVETPLKYRGIGQPVLIPGTMGTASYVLAGASESMENSFGSCCHGAGRSMSRMKAKKTVRGSNLRQELENIGITIRCDSDAGLAEEAPIAYKDVDNVVSVVQEAKLASKVARLRPLAVIKGG